MTKQLRFGLVLMLGFVGYFLLPQSIGASDGFSGSINTACRFEPSLRQYLQTWAAGSDPAYDWIMCPNEPPIPPSWSGLQPGVKEFSLGSIAEPSIYDRLEIRGVTIPTVYHRNGSGMLGGWHEYRQSIRLVIERIDGGTVRTIFDRTFPAADEFGRFEKTYWLVEPNNPPPGECNQPGIDQYQCNSAKVIERGNLNHAHYRYTRTVVGEVRSSVIPLTYNPGDDSGNFTLNVRRNALPAPGPVTLDGISSCDQQVPLHRLTRSASTEATSYSIFRNGELIRVQPEPVYEDRALTEGTAYRYQVRATNAAGWVDSNEVNLTAQQCFDFSVRIEPPSASVQSGSNQAFQAVAVDNLGVSLPADASVAWSLADAASGSLTTSSDPFHAIVQAATLGSYTDDVNVSVTYRGLTRGDAADLTVTAPPTTPPPTTPPATPLTVTLTASPTPVYPRESITVTWTVTAGEPNSRDWIGFYQKDAADRDYFPTDGNGVRAWTYTDAARTGTFTLAAPTTLDRYVFRYFLDNGFQRVAESNEVQVIARPTTPPPTTPPPTTPPPTTPPPTTPPPTTPPPTTPPPTPDRIVRVEGDIFGRESVENLTVIGPSILAAEEIIGVSGTPVELRGYAPTTTADWAALGETMTDRATRLIRNRGKTLTGTTIGGFTQTFNLNSRSGQPTDGDILDNVLLPEGGVWVHDGDLTIRDIRFYNRGTLIIREGNLTIDGTVKYGRTDSRRDSLGIIVLDGDVLMTGRATDVVGAYFVEGELDISGVRAAETPDTTRFVGSIAAREIRVTREVDLEMSYDGRLGVIPPPGFVELIPSKVEESF